MTKQSCRKYLILSIGLLVLTGLSGCFLAIPYIESDGGKPGQVCKSTKLKLARAAKAQREKRRVARKVTPPSIPSIIAKLKNGTTVERTHAAFELGESGVKARSALVALRNSIQSDDSNWVRRAAVKAVEKIDAKAAREILPLALRDKDKWVVHSARNALSRLEKQRPRIRMAEQSNLLAHSGVRARLSPTAEAGH